MKVLIVHDRLPDHPSKDELDTLLEVEQVASALDAEGYLVDFYAFSLDFSLLEKKIETFGPDVVFNLVETLQGSQWLHFATAFLEKLGIPFTGCGSRGMFLTSDKLLAKQLMKLSSIPTPFWVEKGKPEDLPLLLKVPVIVKPVSQEASIGITDESVQTFLTEKSLLDFLGDRDCFAEQYIEGREFNLSLYEEKGKPKVLPPAELLFLDYPEDKPEIAGYEAKWEEDSFAYTHTVRTFDFPDSDQPLLARLKELSLQCWELFSARGYARIDFRVDTKGQAYVLEVNMNPCIAADSGFTAACAQAGLSYTEMIEQIVRGC
jgi:D-alanine-D-alanine ligase